MFDSKMKGDRHHKAIDSFEFDSHKRVKQISFPALSYEHGYDVQCVILGLDSVASPDTNLIHVLPFPGTFS